MTGPGSRRGFLHGLVGLPLIGGGVTLIGQPTAAAEPVTQALLDRYKSWLFAEAIALGREMYDGCQFGDIVDPQPTFGRRWVVECAAEPASTRAAVILAAAGVDWTGRGRS